MDYILNKQNFINATNIDIFFLHGMNWRLNMLLETLLLAVCDGHVFNVYRYYLSVCGHVGCSWCSSRGCCNCITSEDVLIRQLTLWTCNG